MQMSVYTVYRYNIVHINNRLNCSTKNWILLKQNQDYKEFNLNGIIEEDEQL